MAGRNTGEFTPEEIKGALEITTALAGAIKELGEVPAGHLYAQVMAYLTLDSFDSAIRMLVGAKMVTRENNLITWVGGQ